MIPRSIIARAIARRDPAFTRMIASFPRVKLYSFGAVWNETDTEGPLYVYARSTSPRKRMVIFNRNNPSNFVVDIGMDVGFCSCSDRIMMLKCCGALYALWFSDECSFARARSLVKGICSELARAECARRAKGT